MAFRSNYDISPKHSVLYTIKMDAHNLVRLWVGIRSINSPVMVFNGHRKFTLRLTKSLCLFPWTLLTSRVNRAFGFHLMEFTMTIAGSKGHTTLTWAHLTTAGGQTVRYAACIGAHGLTHASPLPPHTCCLLVWLVLPLVTWHTLVGFIDLYRIDH